MANLDTELMDARRVAFLERYAACGVVGPSCRAAGISRTTYLRWRKEEEDFDGACDSAFQCAVDDAELELRSRAVEGVEEPVLYRGEPVWRRDPATGRVLLDDNFEPVPFTIHRRSDRLLEVYVRSHRPVYKEKSEVALTGADGGALEPITVRYVMPEGMTPGDYEHGDAAED